VVGFEENVAVFKVVDCDCYGAPQSGGSGIVVVDGTPTTVPRSKKYAGNKETG
jgi:hypothetical protein